MTKGLVKRLLKVAGVITVATVFCFYAIPNEKWQENSFKKGQLSVINYLRSMGTEKDFYYFDEDNNKVYMPIGSIVSTVGEELDNSPNLDSLLISNQNTYNSK